MEAKAIGRYIGSSPRKMRIVVDLIRGKKVNNALETLHFMPNHASRDAEKVLRSAVANFYVKNDSERVDPSEMVVKEVYVNNGPMVKRILPAPMGRAYRVRKRSNHLTIIVDKKD